MKTKTPRTPRDRKLATLQKDRISVKELDKQEAEANERMKRYTYYFNDLEFVIRDNKLDKILAFTPIQSYAGTICEALTALNPQLYKNNTAIYNTNKARK